MREMDKIRPRYETLEREKVKTTATTRRERTPLDVCDAIHNVAITSVTFGEAKRSRDNTLTASSSVATAVTRVANNPTTYSHCGHPSAD